MFSELYNQVYYLELNSNISIWLGFRFCQIRVKNQHYQSWLLDDKTDCAKFYCK